MCMHVSIIESCVCLPLDISASMCLVSISMVPSPPPVRVITWLFVCLVLLRSLFSCVGVGCCSSCFRPGLFFARSLVFSLFLFFVPSVRSRLLSFLAAVLLFRVGLIAVGLLVFSLVLAALLFFVRCRLCLCVFTCPVFLFLVLLSAVSALRSFLSRFFSLPLSRLHISSRFGCLGFFAFVPLAYCLPSQMKQTPRRCHYIIRHEWLHILLGVCRVVNF